MSGRYVIVGVAGARSPWFADLARWTTSGLLAAEYVKALSMEEVRAILGTGRRVSAVLVSSSTIGLDREFVAVASSVGTSVMVIEDGPQRRDWESLGVATSLDGSFGPDDLTEALNRHAQRIDPARRRSSEVVLSLDDADGLGDLVAVTGTGGAGVSTLSMALAQGLAGLVSERSVAVADLSRNSDLAMYHDIGDVIPGLPELVNAHRGDTPDPDQVRKVLFEIPSRGYSVLLGQRRHRDSAAMPPRSTAAAIDGLRRSFDVVVTDTDPTVLGEAETGSVDIQAFNSAQRHAFSVASLVLVISAPGMRGLRRLSWIIATLGGFGVPPERIVPVINHAPRSPSGRSVLSRTVADMNPLPSSLHPTLFTRRSRLIEDIHNGVSPIPTTLSQPLAHAAEAAISALGQRQSADPVPLVAVSRTARRSKVA